MERIALFTGTFDPFTIGHQNIVERALPLFDKIVISVAMSKLKHAQEEIDEPRIEVESYSDLTIDLAKRKKARFIVRGVRSVKDFEYEREQAEFNKRMGGLETILLFAEPGLASVSSTLVRELKYFGRDVSEFLPNGSVVSEK